MTYTPTNREKKLAPKRGRGKFWCIFCDKAMVCSGEKCSKCKKRNY